ncbi:MAG: TonB C-terminal domain-containing protein [Candidatus Aminicenantes bacterium]|nr:TonB C-terminal domain-containing protein [Candidatus Aminicenantes bacterium]
MKFKAAVFLSVILHISLVAVAIYGPGIKGFGSKETVYYVDFIQMPGGGGGGSSGEGTQAALIEETADKVEIKDGAQSVKDLTVKKETGSKLRYPDQDKKKQKDKPKIKKTKIKKKKKNRELISVVRKDRRQSKPGRNVSRRSSGGGSSNIRIGAGVGTGSGSGTGTGSGSGFGDGSGSGNGFPYAYYIDTIKNKISSSWYNALVSPGLRGTHVVTVYFKILRTGRLKELKIERESGSNSLDLSALRAVENAAPFPPLPGSFPYSYLGVHFEFEWKK